MQDKIVRLLVEAEKILIFPHILSDGDTLGSSVALCKALRKAGKTAFVLIEDPVPAYLSFLDQGYCTLDENMIDEPDICIAVDCSDAERLGRNGDKFFAGRQRICIDHHLTNNNFAQINYVEPEAAATGQIIFSLLKGMGAAFDQEMAEALYTAIATDTGSFQYTNTTKETHLIVAELFEIGIDLEKVSVELYQNTRPQKILIANEALNTLDLFCSGKADIACITQAMLKRTEASMDETEGIIETLRNIQGIEISALLKEQDAERIKVGFRAKTFGDVAKIAQKFGGGGHKKAAGCTIHAPLSEAVRLIKAAITEQLGD